MERSKEKQENEEESEKRVREENKKEEGARRGIYIYLQSGRGTRRREGRGHGE